MKYGKRKGRSGYTITELALGLLIVGGLLLAVFAGYKKLYLPSVAKSEYSKINSVIAGIERARNSMGGVYPAASGTLGTDDDNMNVIKDELGGDNNIKDVKDWQYDCNGGSEGSDVTVTLTTKPMTNDTVARLVARKIMENNAPWYAEAQSDGSIVIKRDHIVCANVTNNNP